MLIKLGLLLIAIGIVRLLLTKPRPPQDGQSASFK
jgi:hypothetical protein